MMASEAAWRPAPNATAPSHWTVHPLGDVAEIVSGVTLGRRLKGIPTRPVPYLRVANVKDGYLDLAEVYAIEATEAEIGKLRLRYGDLLLTEGGDRDKLGRGTFWRGEIDECLHQNHIFRVRFDPERFDPFFVSAQIGSPYGKAYFLAHAKQTTGIATINQKVLAAFPLMVPALPEQQRIAARLAAAMEAVERARAAAEAQLQKGPALHEAYLRAIFGDLAARDGRTVSLGRVLRLRKEIVHPRDNPHGAATFVGLEHIESGTGVHTGGLAVEMADLTGRKPRFHKGDIVYGYLRPYLNKVWIAEFDGLCSVDQYVYDVDTKLAAPEFVAWFMRSPVYLALAPITTTPGQLPRIRTEEVASVQMPLPSLLEQQHTVKLLTAQMQQVKTLANSLREQLEAVNKLPAAILRQAFAGQI